jgi:hypothetical protein
MAKTKPTPLSESLLPIAKGAALPNPELGRRRREPAAERVSLTFRLDADVYELLRRAAFEQRVSQQALVNQALRLLLSRKPQAVA